MDSGSAVTAVSCPFHKALVEAGAPVGELRPPARKLRGANGSQIDTLGCSSCVVSFLGLRTEFPILVCDLITDAIIGRQHLLTLAQGLSLYNAQRRGGGGGHCVILQVLFHAGTLSVTF